MSNNSIKFKSVLSVYKEETSNHKTKLLHFLSGCNRSVSRVSSGVFHTYLHQLHAHPLQVSSLCDFLPQQVSCVGAETVWIIQTQHNSTRAQHMKKSLITHLIVVLNKTGLHIFSWFKI